MRRTIKQIFVATNPEKGGEFRERLYVVADDDSLWRLDDPDIKDGRARSTQWQRLPDLPKP